MSILVVFSYRSIYKPSLANSCGCAQTLFMQCLPIRNYPIFSISYTCYTAIANRKIGVDLVHVSLAVFALKNTKATSAVTLSDYLIRILLKRTGISPGQLSVAMPVHARTRPVTCATHVQPGLRCKPSNQVDTNHAAFPRRLQFQR